MGDPASKENFIFHFRSLPEWLKQSPITFHLLAEFARRARLTEGDVVWNGEIIHLEPRGFITGRIKTSASLGITEGEYRGAYSKLVRYGLIQTIRVTKRYTIGKYCDDNLFFINPQEVSPSEQPPYLPSNNPQPTTNNNDNNEKNVKSRLGKIEPYKESESFKRLRETVERLRK